MDSQTLSRNPLADVCNGNFSFNSSHAISREWKKCFETAHDSTWLDIRFIS